MATINDWYGENNIGWGKSYSESWWGSVNEINSWGIIYPATAEGSIIYADTTLFTADMTSYTADIGVDSVDLTPPTITLIGLSTINLTVGDSYTDAGATATDDVDGDLTSSITTSGTVDTATAGTYTITYSVSDSSGNSASATRSVIVSAASGETPGTISSVDFAILTSLSGLASFSFDYGGTTYTRGMVDDQADITDYDGTSVSGWGTNPIEFDTDTIQVGSFVADGFGTFINSDDTHVSSFGPYAAYSTPKYFRGDFDTAAVFGNPLEAYPIYKVEQSNGYLKVTQIITS